jgi:hypothetical protein
MKGLGRTTWLVVVLLGCLWSNCSVVVGEDYVLPGRVQWELLFGFQPSIGAFGALDTGDGIVVACRAYDSQTGNRDAILFKVSYSGQLLWGHQYYSSTIEDVTRVVAAPDGGVLVAGMIELDEWNRAVWIMKTDSMGRQEWNRTITGLESLEIGGLLSDSEGYYLSGTRYWVARLNSTGHILWNRTYIAQNDWGGIASPTRLLQPDDDGILFIGTLRAVNPINHNRSLHIISINAAGDMMWNHTYNELTCSTIRDIISTDDQGFALSACDSYPNEDYDWIACFDQNATLRWMRNLTLSTWDAPSPLPIANLGRAGLVVASTRFTARFVWDPWPRFLHHYDWNGTLQAIQQAPGTGYEFYTDLIVTSNTSLVAIGGRFYATYPLGAFAAWVAQLAPGSQPVDPIPIIALSTILLCTIMGTVIYRYRHRLLKRVQRIRNDA